jgi:uncharacterized protein YnzC (UPF0291/DUF896 family)
MMASLAVTTSPEESATMAKIQKTAKPETVKSAHRITEAEAPPQGKKRTALLDLIRSVVQTELAGVPVVVNLETLEPQEVQSIATALEGKLNMKALALMVAEEIGVAPFKSQPKAKKAKK